MVFPLNLSCTPHFCFIFCVFQVTTYAYCEGGGGEGGKEPKRENHRIKPTQGAVCPNYMSG